HRRERDEVGELARAQPGESATLVQPAEGQPPVALEAVPAEHGGRERLPAHGLGGVAEGRLDLPERTHRARVGPRHSAPAGPADSSNAPPYVVAASAGARSNSSSTGRPERRVSRFAQERSACAFSAARRCGSVPDGTRKRTWQVIDRKPTRTDRSMPRQPR